MIRGQNLNKFRTRLRVVPPEILERAAQICYNAIYPHVSRMNKDAAAMKSSGMPLSNNTPAGGTSARAWDIFVVTGGVRDSLGIDPIRSRGFFHQTFVGFEDAGAHPTGHPMNDLLAWLFEGTAKIPGRPVIENTFNQEIVNRLPMMLSMTFGLEKM